MDKRCKGMIRCAGSIAMGRLVGEKNQRRRRTTAGTSIAGPLLDTLQLLQKLRSISTSMDDLSRIIKERDNYAQYVQVNFRVPCSTDTLERSD
jgi:hypothetical protein